MADYNISAEITADASGFESGIKKAQKASENLSKSVSGVIQGLGKSGLVGALGAVGLATGGVTAILGTAKKAFQAISKTVNECAEAYRNQYKAEIALETAVKNNPYLDGSSIKGLKQFASEMQRVSEIGDEQFLPMMAQLIATGRTEAETMDIIRVATDMSATGTISFETAIQQLNATLNGNIGRLGQQNSELKNLTEEELKSGKAVEILGNKYKGLASATADSAKQLKNALGDLKENLGSVFEKALAPMRKYFTEVVTNLNNAITKAKGLKEAMADVFKDETVNVDATTENLERAFSEVLHKQQEITRNYSQYIQLYGKYIDEATDETAQAYKAQIKDLNAQLKTISEELNKRRKENEAEKKARAEAEAQAEEEKLINDLKEKYLKMIAEQEKRWANIKKVTGEAVSNEERLKFYQEKLVDIMSESGGKITENNQYYKDQMAIINQILEQLGKTEENSEWQEKLLEQRIEMLETEKERAVSLAEAMGEETYSIERYYNEKLLELKLQRLEEEKEKALENANGNGEEINAINEYYANEEKKIYDELGNYKKKKNEEEEKDEKSKLALMLEYAKQYANKVVAVVKKIASTIKSVVDTTINIFKKLFALSISDALDTLLEFEDSVLTFFVETLPQLPYFVQSVLQSIGTLFASLKNIINADAIKDVVYNMLHSIGIALPQITEDLLSIMVDLVDGAIDGLCEWVETDDGLNTLLNVILTIQTTLEDLIIRNLDKVVSMLETQVEKIGDFLAKSMTSANKTLPKLIRAILRVIKVIIDALAVALTNEEFIDSITDSIMGIIDALIELVPKIAESLIKLIFAVINAIIPKLPEIINRLASEILKIFSSDTGGMFKAFSEGLSTLLKKVMTFEFWMDVLTALGNAIGSIFSGGLAALTRETSGTQTGSQAGDAGLALLTGGVSTIGHALGWWAKGTNNAPAGLAIVGEAGPELVKFRGGEQVLNNRSTNKALENMGGKTNNFNVTFNNLQDTTAFSMMQQFKAYNRQMAINGIL